MPWISLCLGLVVMALSGGALQRAWRASSRPALPPDALAYVTHDARLLGWSVVGLCGLAAGMAILVIGGASAARADTVDLSPLIGVGVEVLSLVLVPVIGAPLALLARKVFSLVNLQIDEKQRGAVDQALEKAIGFGIAEVGGRIAATSKVDIRNQAVAAAASYAVAAVPQALAHFKVDQPRIENMIRARMTALLGG